MKKKALIAFSFIVGSTITFGQEVISSQGDSYSNGTGSIDFTIGEVVINTVSNGTNYLTQGFHQTTWNFVKLEEFDANFVVSIFPNPTQDVLTIQATAFEDVKFVLTDATGRIVMEDILTGELTPLDVASFEAGNYNLSLEKGSSILKTIRLIKTQ
ncbi:MAG: hypothetical protein COA38_20230 [Fluviicola sp.]|nr:MAG: hypothetical protein COA38_20230 [Fluviicola sp.]